MSGSDGDPPDDLLLERPYTVANGRTRTVACLDLISLVHTTGRVDPAGLRRQHAGLLRLCQSSISVVELAGRMQQPVSVTKVLVSDLMESGAVTTTSPIRPSTRPDREILEAVLRGLRTV